MLRLLFDEDVRGDIIGGLRRRQPTLDCVRVQDVGLAHTADALILDWAAQQGRVVVSVDKKTLAVNAWDRVARGLPMPGVAILRILSANVSRCLSTFFCLSHGLQSAFTSTL
jgi:predicted nuclease of predicted toxin-antitoxin system